MPEVLVVASTIAELSGLPPDVRRSAIGHGDVDAACGIASVLAIGIAKCVLLVGTCGALTPGLEHDQVLVVEQAVRPVRIPGVELSAEIATQVPADRALAELLATRLEVQRVVCASGRGMTISDEEAALAAQTTGAQVENLECFSVLRACARVGVPATAILSVAYRAGQGARDDAAEHRSVAEAHAIASLARALAFV